MSIDIIAKVIVDVDMVTPQAKLTYQVGDDFDHTWIELLGEYNDGSSKKLET